MPRFIMSTPILGRSTTSFQAWNSQLEAFFVLKSISEADRLKVLPACLEEEVLIRVQSYLSLGTTTYQSAIMKIKKAWMDLRRPSNPEKMFANLSFSQPSEAADAITQLKWLAEYLDYDSNIIKKRFISSAPEHLQPLLLSRSSGKLDAIVDFVLQCPDTSSSIFGAVSKDAISNNSSRKYDKK